MYRISDLVNCMFMVLKWENIRSLFLIHIILIVSFLQLYVCLLTQNFFIFHALLQWDMIVKAVTFVVVLESVSGFMCSCIFFLKMVSLVHAQICILQMTQCGCRNFCLLRLDALVQLCFLGWQLCTLFKASFGISQIYLSS